MLPAVGRSHYSLDAFRLRSDRFLFARRRPAAGNGDGERGAAPHVDVDDVTTATGGLVYLEQGQAHAMRAQTRRELRCPEPACAAPDITTVSRSTGGARDGFRHLRRPGTGAHAPESVMHRQAKALVARWADGHPSVAAVQVEASLGGGERVADVLLTSRSGNRMAVEIQFAGLTLDSYLERTRSYASLGITVVWLWGNCGPHSPRIGHVSALHQLAVRDARPLLWVNPADEVIAWAHARRPAVPLRDQQRPPQPPRGLLPNDYGYDVSFGNLDDLDVRATGLFPPGWSELRARARDRAHDLALNEVLHRAAELKRAAAADAAAAARRTAREWRSAERSTFSQWDRQHRQAARSAAAAGKPRCRRCGLPLDPVLWAAGQHLGDCTRFD